jgi:hypothetical protein
MRGITSEQVAAVLMALVLLVCLFNTFNSMVERQRIETTLEAHAALARDYVIKSHDCPKVNQGSEVK